FGVEGYDGISNPSIPKLVGSLTVDSTTGDVLYQDGTTGNFTETGTVVPVGQWAHYTLEMNYGTQKYTVYVNGVPLATTDFVDPGIVAFSDAPLATLAAAGDPLSLAAPGTPCLA